MNKKNHFIFNWILINRLAIGNSPKENENVTKLIKMV